MEIDGMTVELPEQLRPKGVIFVEPGTKLSPEVIERIRQEFTSYQGKLAAKIEAIQDSNDGA